MSSDPRANLVANIRVQAHGCCRSGSPFYGALFDRMADDVERLGPFWRLLEPFAPEPFGTVRPLRIIGALHKLVLSGDAPALALHFPSVGGDGDATAAWPMVVTMIGERQALIAHALERPVQTNEVTRSVGLVGGFLWLAREAQLPLALREIGCSGGLNLRIDRYWYQQGARGWGDATSRVRFVDWFRDGEPPFDAPLRIVDRRGCDRFPIDVTTDDGATTLLGFVWPGQDERFVLLRDALAAARPVPVDLEQADAVDWVGRVARVRAPGTMTVIYHSIVWQYLDRGERDRIVQSLHDAGSSATRDAPLAWLRLEPPAGAQSPVELRVTTWPRGDERLLAIAGFHRDPVRWLADG
ncbi:MAG: DUF2332 domain-containing protein [Actinobacteria bacterium]|nr:MAG: DUF2332 domain-containing protein [Actinomycetota bacterium]